MVPVISGGPTITLGVMSKFAFADNFDPATGCSCELLLSSDSFWCHDLCWSSDCFWCRYSHGSCKYVWFYKQVWFLDQFGSHIFDFAENIGSTIIDCLMIPFDIATFLISAILFKIKTGSFPLVFTTFEVAKVS